jgi:guanosine-3',5'-bis(diphosphate) 3'-pyrophosphohydrolase
LLSKYGNRVIKAKWTSQAAAAFVAGISLNGIDRVGMIQDISKVISSELHINMRSISVDTKDGIFDGFIKVYINDTKHLDTLMKKMEGIEGIFQVIRTDIQESQNQSVK